MGYSSGSKSPKVSLGFSKIATLFVGHTVFLSFLGNLVDTIHIFGDSDRRRFVLMHTRNISPARGSPFAVGAVRAGRVYAAGKGHGNY
jgi:hypothetical protein